MDYLEFVIMEFLSWSIYYKMPKKNVGTKICDLDSIMCFITVKKCNTPKGEFKSDMGGHMSNIEPK